MRNGRTLRQRLEALGFSNPDFDERVHDLLDWVDEVVERCESFQEAIGVMSHGVRDPQKGRAAVESFLDDSSPY